MEAAQWLNKLGGRKFLLSIIVLIIGTVVQLYGKQGVNESFVALLIGALGVFNAANAVVSSKFASKPEEAPAVEEVDSAPAPDNSELQAVSERVTVLEEQLSQAHAVIGQHQQYLATLGNAVDNVNKRLLAK
jgi:hypothetical protein